MTLHCWVMWSQQCERFAILVFKSHIVPCLNISTFEHEDVGIWLDTSSYSRWTATSATRLPNLRISLIGFHCRLVCISSMALDLRKRMLRTDCDVLIQYKCLYIYIYIYIWGPHVLGIGHWAVRHNMGHWNVSHRIGHWAFRHKMGHWNVSHRIGHWAVRHNMGHWNVSHRIGCWTVSHRIGHWTINHNIWQWTATGKDTGCQSQERTDKGLSVTT
jgi:hypothetical protein